MFWTNFERCCRMIGEPPNSVASKCGVKSSGTVTGWKNGAIPRADVSRAIVEYFKSKGVQIEASDLFDDGDAIATRERLRSSPGMRILFDAAEDAPESALLEAAALIMRYKEESKRK